MNLGTRISKLSPQLNIILKTIQPKLIDAVKGQLHLPPTGTTVSCSTPKIPKVSSWSPGRFSVWGELNQQATSEDIPNKPYPIIRQIIDPNPGTTSAKIEIPLRTILNENLELPCNVRDIEKIDPIKNPVEKKAKRKPHMLIIRRKKMRKHKLVKRRKKQKFVLIKRAQHREMRKEMLFQAGLKDILREGEQFSAEQYLQNKLDTLNWVPPVTRARGRLAPQWVIKEELEKERLKKIYDERIEECVKSRDGPS